MGCFDRPKRKQTMPEIPARLQQLDRELMKDQTKSFDYLYAVRSGLRVRICVLRDEDCKFFATAQIGKKAFRVQGGGPSGAFWMLSIIMGTHLAEMPSAKRQRLLAAQEVANV